MATKSPPVKSSPSPPTTYDAPPEEVPPPPPPPADTWPCGCPYPNQHQTDCMWSMWEQMRDNYQQTKTLMGQFMNQVDKVQGPRPDQPPCQCPPGCHGRDLGEAMGLQQMQGVTVPWLGQQQLLASQSAPPSSLSSSEDYSVKSENRKLLEEQKRLKSTWVQFLNIFDMALNLANDVSKDRCEAMKRRKEREHLERKQRREEACRERQERRERCKDERTQSKDEPEDDAQKTKTDDKKRKSSQPKPSKEPEATTAPQREASLEPESSSEPEPTTVSEPEPQAEPEAEAEAEGEE